MSNVDEIFKSKGYEPYTSQNFYSNNTFIEKTGRNAEHINSNVNGKNSGWPNAAHIILPLTSYNINVLAEAQSSSLLTYLERKLNKDRNFTYIYQPKSFSLEPPYQRYKITLSSNGSCTIAKDGLQDRLDNLVPDLSKMPNAPSTPFAANVPSTPFDADATHLPPQIIYYGVPGCGKSNKINKALEKVSDERKIRTVFHPEYTNADFVGQILPKTDDGNISYEFTPGPFTEIIKRAGQEPSEDFYLIIEEINRGNAAAIFGDIFQLLDRDENGVSQYSIQNKDIAQYINNQDNGIRLPKNLSIIATMNTSDQNVFTLDNAFQRRFDLVLVRSGVTRSEKAKAPSPDSNDYKFEPDEKAIHTQFEAKIEGANIPWGFFWDWVNSEIAGTLRGLSGTEDKRLGLWFVKNKNGEIPKKVFAEKVLKYLWDDAFKFKRKEIFCENIQSLESLIDTFEKCKNLSEIFRDFPKDAIQNKA